MNTLKPDLLALQGRPSARCPYRPIHLCPLDHETTLLPDVPKVFSEHERPKASERRPLASRLRAPGAPRGVGPNDEGAEHETRASGEDYRTKGTRIRTSLVEDLEKFHWLYHCENPWIRFSFPCELRATSASDVSLIVPCWFSSYLITGSMLIFSRGLSKWKYRSEGRRLVLGFPDMAGWEW